MATNTEINRAAIVGTGLIGSSWAAFFLAHGLDDGPTHRSFARLESNGRPCHTVEIRVATVATGNLSAGGKRWR
jgi:hypothetical protein